MTKTFYNALSKFKQAKQLCQEAEGTMIGAATPAQFDEAAEAKLEMMIEMKKHLETMITSLDTNIAIEQKVQARMKK